MTYLDQAVSTSSVKYTYLQKRKHTLLLYFTQESRLASGLILGLNIANEIWRYYVTTCLSLPGCKPRISPGYILHKHAQQLFFFHFITKYIIDISMTIFIVLIEIYCLVNVPRNWSSGNVNIDWIINTPSAEKFREISSLILTHWGRVTHMCVSKQTIIGSYNGLSPGRRQAIIWTNARILLTRPLGTNLSDILIGIQTFSFMKTHLKMSSVKWRPFCLGVNVLIESVKTTSMQKDSIRILSKK